MAFCRKADVYSTTSNCSHQVSPKHVGQRHEATFHGQQGRISTNDSLVQQWIIHPGDPLRWWKENEGRFPALSKLARCLLCVPATSTPAELIFSAAGNIGSQKRTSLTWDQLEMLEVAPCNSWVFRPVKVCLTNFMWRMLIGMHKMHFC